MNTRAENAHLQAKCVRTNRFCGTVGMVLVFECLACLLAEQRKCLCSVVVIIANVMERQI